MQLSYSSNFFPNNCAIFSFAATCFDYKTWPSSGSFSVWERNEAWYV